MEQEIQFIQYQLWFLIGILALLVATNVICYFSRKSEEDKSQNFSEMWSKGQLDELVIKSRECLLEYPNQQDALYFGAKAMIAQRKNLDEARKYLERFVEIEPSFSEAMQESIDEINKIQGR